MPKKRSLNFKHIQQSHSSSASSSVSHSHGASTHESPATVNERLSELRQIETPEGLQKKLELAATVNQASVPPELRGILGVPETAPPKPKLGVRLRERMRTPGPAPPKSWLAYRPEWQPTLVVRGGKGKKKAAASVAAVERNRPKQLLRFTRLLAGRLDDGEKQPSSLLHLALTRLADQWNIFDEEDYPTLIEIPLRLRLRLLSYLGYYGPPIDVAAFAALTAGSERILQLDLGGLAGHFPLTLKPLSKTLEPVRSVSDWIDDDEVADSWDTEDPGAEELRLSPTISRFATLTQLSLSNPPATASWRDLLGLAKTVPQLTHLSLAYWPRPTLTPNLVSATISAQGSPEVRAGGSHFYSSLDADYAEPCALLRQLSHSLLCLQWLDVEGCVEWAPALGMLAEGPPLPIPIMRSTAEDGWTAPTHTHWNVFTETWKSLTYIRCAQGWLPNRLGIDALLALPTLSQSPTLRSTISHRIERFPESAADDQYEVELRKARVWVIQEQRLFATQYQINNARRAKGCKAVTVDFGWA